MSGRKKDFPWFQSPQGAGSIYLDSAATTQKPRSVLHSMQVLYEEYNAPVNRSSHGSSEIALEMYLDSHKRMARFLGGDDPGEIIFTRNCTGSLNLLANAILHSTKPAVTVNPGEKIVTTIMEHHSNTVPWQELARLTGAELVYAEIDDDGHIDVDHFTELISDGARLAAFSHASNVLGTINPVKELVRLCADHGVLSCIDGAQAVPHMNVDLKEIGCDFYALSGHKIFGPLGVGVLYGKRALLEKMTPGSFGGGMVEYVSKHGSDWSSLPWKFEAGTPDFCGAVALTGADDPETGRHIDGAIDYVSAIGMDKITLYEKELTAHAMNSLRQIDGIRLLGPQEETGKTGIISFTISKNEKLMDCHTAGMMLAQAGVILRAGSHCAYPLIDRLGVPGTVRISFSVYNDTDDINRFISCLKEIIPILL